MLVSKLARSRTFMLAGQLSMARSALFVAKTWTLCALDQCEGSVRGDRLSVPGRLNKWPGEDRPHVWLTWPLIRYLALDLIRENAAGIAKHQPSEQFRFFDAAQPEQDYD